VRIEPGRQEDQLRLELAQDRQRDPQIDPVEVIVGPAGRDRQVDGEALTRSGADVGGMRLPASWPDCVQRD